MTRFQPTFLGPEHYCQCVFRDGTYTARGRYSSNSGPWYILPLIMVLFPAGLRFGLRILLNTTPQRATMSQEGLVCQLKPICHCVQLMSDQFQLRLNPLVHCTVLIMQTREFENFEINSLFSCFSLAHTLGYLRGWYALGSIPF